MSLEQLMNLNQMNAPVANPFKNKNKKLSKRVSIRK